MKKELVLEIRRQISRALKPTGLVRQRGPALTVQCLVRKIVREELKQNRVVIKISEPFYDIGGSGE